MLHVALLLDESGSMMPFRQDVIGGYNTYIEKLNEQEGEVRVSLFMFDANSFRPMVRDHFLGHDLDTIKKLTDKDYNPMGATPLNDAVIESIKRMKKLIDKDDDVIFAIYTDGYENASNASTEEVKARIQKREAKGWEFIYLAANQDAWAVAQGYGLAQKGKTFTTVASGAGVQASTGTLANMTNTAREARSKGVYSVGDGGTLSTAYGDKDKIDEQELEEK